MDNLLSLTASEIIVVKAIVSVLATCMLYTGHVYPLVNEADICCALHHTRYSHVRCMRDRLSLSR